MKKFLSTEVAASHRNLWKFAVFASIYVWILVIFYFCISTATHTETWEDEVMSCFLFGLLFDLQISAVMYIFITGMMFEEINLFGFKRIERPGEEGTTSTLPQQGKVRSWIEDAV